MNQPEMITADDGHSIALYHWPAEGQPRGVVHWLHGMAEHGRRYQSLAQYLTASGWHLYAHDHRGHGASVKDEQDRGHFADKDGWDKVLADVGRVQGHIRQQQPSLPLVLAGHSMGSFIALGYAQRHPDGLTGLILCGSNWHPQWYYRLMSLPIMLERWRLGSRGISKLIKRMTFDNFARQVRHAHTEFDWLSNDPDEVQAYIRDPWCGHDCTTGLWSDLVSGIREAHQASGIRKLSPHTPLLLIAGDSDPMSRNGVGMKQLLAALLRHGRAATELHEFAGARHEILNDLCRQQVFDCLNTWIEDKKLSQSVAAPALKKYG